MVYYMIIIFNNHPRRLSQVKLHSPLVSGLIVTRCADVFSCKVDVLDSVLSVSQEVVRHEQSADDGEDGEHCCGDDHDFHGLTVGCEVISISPCESSEDALEAYLLSHPHGWGRHEGTG